MSEPFTSPELLQRGLEDSALKISPRSAALFEGAIRALVRGVTVFFDAGRADHVRVTQESAQGIRSFRISAATIDHYGAVGAAQRLAEDL